MPDINRLVDFLVLALPPAAAVLTTIVNVLNLWLAGRIVAMSGRLKRPQPDLPSMQFPSYAPLLTGAAIAASFLPGMIGTAAGVLAAAMLMAYAMLGFAVLHHITRGMNAPRAHAGRRLRLRVRARLARAADDAAGPDRHRPRHSRPRRRTARPAHPST